MRGPVTVTLKKPPNTSYPRDCVASYAESYNLTMKRFKLLGLMSPGT